MKKIVLNASELINLADVSNYAKVGIRWECGGKCMIIQTSDGFVGVDKSLNIVHCWKADSIKEYIGRALTQGNNEDSEAFYFSEASELFEWMSK